MHCLVTAGPTYESLDAVRRLTNFSTGALGAGLAAHLSAQGHRVTLLKGYYAVFSGPIRADEVVPFTNTADLRQQLKTFASKNIDAIFHAAAVSDFGFGKVYRRSDSGSLTELRSGKFSTRDGPLLVELVPTPKIIEELRSAYPAAFLVGWKFEVDGGRMGALRAGTAQLARCCTNACVVNGPAYGDGFGLIVPEGETVHFADSAALFQELGDRLAGAIR